LADLIQQKNALKSLQILVQDKDRLLKDECDKINTFVKSAGERLTKGWMFSIKNNMNTFDYIEQGSVLFIKLFEITYGHLIEMLYRLTCLMSTTNQERV